MCAGVGQAAGLTHDDWTRSILDSESVTDTAHTLEADQLLWSSWKKTATADSRTQRSPNAAMSKSTRSSVTSTCACECQTSQTNPKYSSTVFIMLLNVSSYRNHSETQEKCSLLIFYCMII